MQKLHIVMGLGPSGLFLVRQLAKLNLRIAGIGRADDIGIYSKYLKNAVYIAQTVEELNDTFAKLCETEKPVLHVCSDQYLTLLSSNAFHFWDRVELSGCDFEFLQLINDKSRLNQKLTNFKLPQTCSYAQLCDGKIGYPVILKWNVKQINQSKKAIDKIKILPNQEAFQDFDRTVRDSGFDAGQIFVQTYIRGDNARQFSVGGYFKNGEPLATIAVNQTRQYPQGISAYVVEYTGRFYPDIMQLTLQFAKENKYSGFLEMEYKADSETDAVYLLDINPRPWGWVSIMGAKYPDFYKVFLGEKPKPTEKTVAWKNSFRTLLSIRNPQNVKTSVRADIVVKDLYEKGDNGPQKAFFAVGLKKIKRNVLRRKK